MCRYDYVCDCPLCRGKAIQCTCSQGDCSGNHGVFWSHLHLLVSRDTLFSPTVRGERLIGTSPASGRYFAGICSLRSAVRSILICTFPTPSCYCCTRPLPARPEQDCDCLCRSNHHGRHLCPVNNSHRPFRHKTPRSSTLCSSFPPSTLHQQHVSQSYSEYKSVCP